MRVAIPLSLALLLLVQGAAAQSAGAPSSPDQHIDTVQVTAPKVPLDKAINNFVKSYAAPSIQADKIPKWASGICPMTEGLTPSLNLGVTALLKLVAAQVGAPVATKAPCNTNVEIIFTRTPQAVLDDIAKNYEDLLGYHDVAQTKRIATMSHPIQAWYATATRDDNGSLVSDSAQQSPMCAEADAEIAAECGGGIKITGSRATTACSIAVQNFVKYCGGRKVTGSRITDGLKSEFAYVTVVVDVNKLGELGIKSVANYVAMLALSQTQAFETCQPLSSITNLMTTGCDSTFKPNTISSNDIAYLNALYKMNPDNMLGGQQSDIAHQMETTLGAH
jgi:hypothetical protein